MSMILSTFAPEDRRGSLQVSLASTDAELREVQRLRYRIYVEEKRILHPRHEYVVGDRLVDPYDAWSSHLLLRRGGRPVGTVRVTEAADGALELDQYTDVRRHLPHDAKPAELTRYMVLADQRRSKAGPLLLYGAMQIITSSRSTHLVAASKVGSLSKYYRSVGLQLLDAPPFTYGLTGCEYRLGAIDFGKPGSLRRAAMRTGYGALKVGSDVATPLVHYIFRRRLQPGPARPSVAPPPQEVQLPGRVA